MSATFYYPNRGAPAVTVSVDKLESYPSSRPLRKHQVRAETPGGEPIVYDMGPVVLFLRLIIKNLSQTDKDNVKDFFQTTCNFSSVKFDFTDDLGTEYDSCLLWQDDLDFSLTSPGLYEEELLLRVSP